MWFEEAKERIAQVSGIVGFLVKNLNTGETFSVNDDLVFPSASTIKVPILLTLLDAHAAGTIDIDSPAPVTPQELVGGCGLIQHLNNAIAYTLRDHAVLMIILSDNVATNKLISTLGMDAINAKIREMGASATVLGRKMMDAEARKQGRDNFTSCRDMLKIFTYIHQNADRYADALAILKQQQLNDLLPVWTPREEYEFAHKTGELDGIRHDVGIMYLDDPIFVAFYTKELKDEHDGIRLANDLGALVYRQYKAKQPA